MRKSYNITILGQNLSVMHDSGDAYVAEVFRYVVDKVQETQKGTAGASAVTVAILTALNIADDYFNLRNANDMIYNQLENKSENLIRLLNDIR